jgi:hypothetical protein
MEKWTVGATLGTFSNLIILRRRKRNGKEYMVTYRDIRNTRIFFWLLLLALGLFGLAIVTAAIMVAWKVPAHDGSPYVFAIGIAAIVSFFLGLVLFAAVSKESALLLQGWKGEFKQPFTAYPLNDVERDKLTDWALRVLAYRADIVRKAFDVRDGAQTVLDNARRDEKSDASDRTQCLDPLELMGFRKYRDLAQKKTLRAEYKLLKATAIAGEAFRRYLNTWDILVHPEPKGAGILSKNYEGKDPAAEMRGLASLYASIQDQRNRASLRHMGAHS